MSTCHPRQYKTKNWPTYNRSLVARGPITLLFDETMQWYGHRQGKRGKPQRFSEAAIQFCLSIKVVFRLPLRQCTGFVGSLLKLARLDWAVPDYTTLCRRQEYLNVRIPYTPSREGLHLLVDSTGIKFLGEGEWKRKKHGVGYRRQWRKAHLGIDAQTLQIRAIAVTDSSIGDNTALPEIIGQIPEEEVIAKVTGDGAFDTRNCYEATVARGAIPCFPPRRNARISPSAKTAGARARNEAIRTAQRVGRTIWKQWSEYHQRSLVETKMYCFKQLGDKLMARTFDRQVAELHIRTALLNRFSMLPQPETVAVA